MINIPYPNQEILNNFFNVQKVEILKRIEAIKKDKSISRKNKKYKVTPYIKKLLLSLEDESNLKDILLAHPNGLIEIIKYYEENFKEVRHKKEALHNILYRIFVDHGYEKIDKLQFIENIGLGSCPYCNRNYVFTISNNGSIKPEIDHFILI